MKPPFLDMTATPVAADATVTQADWLKGRALEIPGVNSAKELRAFLKRVGVSVAKFRRLPAYRENLKRIPWLKDL